MPSSTTTTPSRRRSTAATAARTCGPTAPSRARSGEVLRHDGEVIVAYFHSTSGGHTENNENVWGGTPLAYIRGVRDPWDRYSPYHRWKLRYSARSLGRAMGVGRLRAVHVHKRGVSGRIVRATFRGSARPQPRRRLGRHPRPARAARHPEHDQADHRERLDRPRRGRRPRLARARARRLRIGLTRPQGREGRRPAPRPTDAGSAWRKGRLGRSGRYRIAVEGAGLYRVVTGGDAGPTLRVR